MLAVGDKVELLLDMRWNTINFPKGQIMHITSIAMNANGPVFSIANLAGYIDLCSLSDFRLKTMKLVECAYAQNIKIGDIVMSQTKVIFTVTGFINTNPNCLQFRASSQIIGLAHIFDVQEIIVGDYTHIPATLSAGQVYIMNTSQTVNYIPVTITVSAMGETQVKDEEAKPKTATDCTCGSESIGSPNHSKWCDKYA